MGVGSISIIKHKKTEMVQFKISSKTHLIEIIIPIFDKYPMLTSKHYDYINFRSNLFNNITKYERLQFYTRPNKTPYNSIKDILNLNYFDNWLVGFIEAESCFSIYKATKDNDFTASFDISQTNGEQIILAIKERLSITSNPFLYLNNYKLKTTSKRGIQNILIFLKSTPAKLKGYKRIQYISWLHGLRKIKRYNTLNIPSTY